jgi:hypothetical protein
MSLRFSHMQAGRRGAEPGTIVEVIHRPLTKNGRNPCFSVAVQHKAIIWLRTWGRRHLLRSI